MTISIIICTRNRAEHLKPTLESISRVLIPAKWSAELLIVDNGSSDHTQSIVCNAYISNLVVRYISQPKIGLSHARNAGLDEAKGQVIVFTDDDLRFQTDWIESICRPIVCGEADAVAGGIVFPPEHAADLAQQPFASRRTWYASTEKLDPDHPGEMIGANMAFHRRLIEHGLKFDIELGTGALGFGEETLFSLQLLSLGYRLKGALDVQVEHHFDRTRLRRENLISAANRMGRSHAFIFHHWRQRRLKAPISHLVWSYFRRSMFRLRDTILRVNSIGVSESGLESEQNVGFFSEYLRQRSRPRKYDRSDVKRIRLHSSNDDK